MENLRICPVCGYEALPDVPYDEYGYPTYVICPCCGFEFGFDDESNGFTFESYRQKWIEDGFPFFNKKKKGKHWSAEELNCQLENVKKVHYKSRN